MSPSDESRRVNMAERKLAGMCLWPSGEVRDHTYGGSGFRHEAGV